MILTIPQTIGSCQVRGKKSRLIVEVRVPQYQSSLGVTFLFHGEEDGGDVALQTPSTGRSYKDWSVSTTNQVHVTQSYLNAIALDSL